MRGRSTRRSAACSRPSATTRRRSRRRRRSPVRPGRPACWRSTTRPRPCSWRDSTSALRTAGATVVSWGRCAASREPTAPPRTLRPPRRRRATRRPALTSQPRRAASTSPSPGCVPPAMSPQRLRVRRRHRGRAAARSRTPRRSATRRRSATSATRSRTTRATTRRIRRTPSVGGRRVPRRRVDRRPEPGLVRLAQLLRAHGLEQQGARLLRLGRVAGHGGLGAAHLVRVDVPAVEALAGGRRTVHGVRARRARVEAASPRELSCEVGLLEAVDPHARARMGGVDEPVAAERHPDVVDIAARVAEEHEVAGPEVAAVHRLGVAGEDLLLGGPRDPDPGLGVCPLHEARAVEAGLRGRAAPAVRRAHVPARLGERRPGTRPGWGSLAGDDLVEPGRAVMAGAAGPVARVPEEAAGVVEAQLVPAAVFGRRPLDVGDPLPVALRVVDGLAGRNARGLDLDGVVDEPLELKLRALWIAGVLALVPDAVAHLEEPQRVPVAACEVPHAGFDEGRHHGKLGRQAAGLRLPRHPRGDVPLRGVVAGVARGAGSDIDGATVVAVAVVAVAVVAVAVVAVAVVAVAVVAVAVVAAVVHLARATVVGVRRLAALVLVVLLVVARVVRVRIVPVVAAVAAVAIVVGAFLAAARAVRRLLVV